MTTIRILAPIFFFALALMPLAAVNPVNAQQPPRADTLPHEEVRHGEVVRDDYYWLREKSNPKVIHYLEEENAYTERMTRDIQPLANRIYGEIKGRLKETDLSVPVRRGQYYYYTRTEAGKQYAILCRKPASADGGHGDDVVEQVLLDGNELARGEKFFAIGETAVSDDAARLAFTTDTNGFRQYTLHVKNLASGETAERLAERVTSVEWAADGETLFYVTEDATTKRSDTLWRQRAGGAATKIYFEADPAFDIAISRTRDKAYLRLSANSFEAWETRLLPTTQPAGKFRLVLPREKGHKYDVEHRRGLLYIRTNKAARDFRVVTAPVGDPRPGNWKPFIDGQAGTLIEGISLFHGSAVAFERANAIDRLRIYDFAKHTWQTISFDEPIYALFASETPEFNAKKVRVNFQSPVTPPTVMDIDMASGERTVLKRQEVLGGYDASRYETHRLWATARDGVKVPLSMVYRKGVKQDGSAPLLLYAYGSYGLEVTARFQSSVISLLDRGAIYVIAHIRGGNELGEGWYEDGKLMTKKNTFFDFIDSAEYLSQEKWTSPDRLMIEGGSAGGLLMGAVVNMRPDLFHAVHAAVPFVDVMNTMFDSSLPLTQQEYLQWGNPYDKPAYDYMRSYSPYDNIERKRYPAMLVTTSLNDSQVMYWEPAKYVAKLRAFKTGDNPLLLKTNMAGGHGGASGRYDVIKDRSFELAWLLWQTGVRE